MIKLSRRVAARRGRAAKLHHENATGHNFTHYDWLRLIGILGIGVSRLGTIHRIRVGAIALLCSCSGPAGAIGDRSAVLMSPAPR